MKRSQLCDQTNIDLKDAKSSENETEITNRQELHHPTAEAARIALTSSNEESKHNSNIQVITFDL